MPQKAMVTEFAGTGMGWTQQVSSATLGPHSKIEVEEVGIDPGSHSQSTVYERCEEHQPMLNNADSFAMV